jgi:hypothetical protein
MNSRFKVLAVVLVVGLVFAVGAVDAAKKMKIKEYTAQVGYTFVNNEGVPAYGLVVALSADAVVETDDNNQAGPFRNVSGNSSKQIQLGHPVEPVGATESVELTFKSYNKKLKVSKWWWTDQQGKRIGKKQKA